MCKIFREDSLMLKKYALAAALVCFAALLTGCAMDDTAAPENTAETGVDIISLGALTHSVKAFDISMKWKK